VIAVDTSALMTIALREPKATACMDALKAASAVLISAGTVAETMIVAVRRDIAEDMQRLIDGLGLRIINVTPVVAQRVAQAYAQWGKGLHPASLNFGDCFSYAVAKEHDCPLLYVGNHFAQTDIKSAL
jgi:ribonuclease VapC